MCTRYKSKIHEPVIVWNKLDTKQYTLCDVMKINLNSVKSVTWKRKWQPTPVFLPRESCGQRSLVGYSPWGLEESDVTKQLYFHFSLSWTGEGNGNPLQYSCLENPRDGGAWWAAVYGVAQSQIWLRWLSNSSTLI